MIKGEYQVDLADLNANKVDAMTTRLNDLNSELNTRKLTLKMKLQQSEEELEQLQNIKRSYQAFFQSLKELVKTNPALIETAKSSDSNSSTDLKVRRVFAMAPKYKKEEIYEEPRLSIEPSLQVAGTFHFEPPGLGRNTFQLESVQPVFDDFPQIENRQFMVESSQHMFLGSR